MSKQIIFYSTIEDLPSMFFWLKENGYLIIKGKIVDFDNRNIEKVEDLFQQHQIYITTHGFELKYGFVENYHYHYLDVLYSSAIEISFPIVLENKFLLKPSRIYVKTSYYKEGQLLRKDKLFLSFVESFFKEFKNKFLKKYSGKYYKLATQNAIMLLNSGYAEGVF